jgi:hypothetical protein
MAVWAWNTNLGKRLSTIDLLIKEACFVKQDQQYIQFKKKLFFKEVNCTGPSLSARLPWYERLMITTSELGRRCCWGSWGPRSTSWSPDPFCWTDSGYFRSKLSPDRSVMRGDSKTGLRSSLSHLEPELFHAWQCCQVSTVTTGRAVWPQLSLPRKHCCLVGRSGQPGSELGRPGQPAVKCRSKQTTTKLCQNFDRLYLQFQDALEQFWAQFWNPHTV